MKELIKKLKYLKDNHNLIGIKQSFEDEGIDIDEMKKMRMITSIAKVPLGIKIGGCAALSDINSSIFFGIDRVIAPMVESKFAIRQFIDTIYDNGYNNKVELFVNIETINAYNNIDEMFEPSVCDELTGIVVGRSDLCKSMGLTKQNVDDKQVLYIVSSIMSKAKKCNLKTIMGGNLTKNSLEFINSLKINGLIDAVETRNVLMEITDINKVSNNIEEAIKFELDWITYKNECFDKMSKDNIKRINSLKLRLS